jgi:serine protease inhibitor
MSKPHLPLALLLLTGCGSSSTGPGGEPPPVLTELPRALSGSEVRLVEGANRFAFELLRNVTTSVPADSNVFLSPLSASLALGMTLNGAVGTTYEEMRSALGLAGVSEQDINRGYRDLINLLTTLDSRAELRVANSIWAESSLPLEPAFAEVSGSFFDAEVATLDFRAPASVETINGWVKEKTVGRIPRLLEELSPREVLFLINAIYFKGKWRTPFDPDETREAPFRGADGRSRSARLMWRKDNLRYQETDAYQAVDLLYGNGAFAMTVLLPRSGRAPAEILGGLTPESWAALVGGFRETELTLALPRFRVEYGRRLDDDLKAMGMRIAFESAADFSRIADVGAGLYITRVVQKTFVEVNEEGTEAAAATGVGVGRTSVGNQMLVDRPFVFAIRERLSGAVIFLGVMNVVGE